MSNLPNHGRKSLNCCEQKCFNYVQAQVNLIPPSWYIIAFCIIGHYIWPSQSQQQLQWWFISSAVKFLVHDYIASLSLNQLIGKLAQYWFITLYVYLYLWHHIWKHLTFEEPNSFIVFLYLWATNLQMKLYNNKTLYQDVLWSGEFWCSARLAHNSWGISEIGKASTPLCGFCSTIKREYVRSVNLEWTRSN